MVDGINSRFPIPPLVDITGVLEVLNSLRQRQQLGSDLLGVLNHRVLHRLEWLRNKAFSWKEDIGARKVFRDGGGLRLIRELCENKNVPERVSARASALFALELREGS